MSAAQNRFCLAQAVEGLGTAVPIRLVRRNSVGAIWPRCLK